MNLRSMLSREKLIDMFTTMLKIRMFDEECCFQHSAGRIPGMFYSYSGQEAIAVGVCSNLRSDDLIASTYRSIGHLIAKGADIKFIMAEMYGKNSGYNRGKGGSTLVMSHELGILCTSGVVGGCIPIALGGALAAKMKKTDQVTVCFFGDGASNQGNFHESLNLASVWKLPLLFVVENNQYSFTTPRKKHQNIEKISQRAVSYGVPGMTTDGNDVLQVYDVAKKFVEQARNGEGPALMECLTYNKEEARKYYSDDPELRKWEETYGDPIEKFQEKLLEWSILTRDDIEEIRETLHKEVNGAALFALDRSTYPDPEEIYRDIYAGGE